MATPPCKPFPTSNLLRLNVREPCGKIVEAWSLFSGGLTVPVATLQAPGSNWDNAKALVGAGGGFCAGVSQDCNQPLFSRTAFGISRIKANWGSAQPSDSLTLPPLIHFEIRVGFGCAVSRVTRLIWTPQSWEDSCYLTQITGTLVSQIELWGWCEPVTIADQPVEIPLLLDIHLGIDRSGTADPNAFINAFANITGDNS